MKICKKCGAMYRDKKIFCVDCGERLPDPVPQEQEAELRLKLRKNIDRLHRESDPLKVDLKMKIAAALDILCATISLILMILNTNRTLYSIYAILFYIPSFVEAVFPEVGWNLTKLKDIFTYDNPESLQPSHTYGTMRKISVWAGLALGIFFTLLGLTQ